MGQLMLAGYHTPFLLAPFVMNRMVIPFFSLPSFTSDYDIGALSLYEYGGLAEADADKAITIINSWKDLLVSKKILQSRNIEIPRDIRESRLVRFSVTSTRAGETNPLLSIFTAMGFQKDAYYSLLEPGYEHINTFLAGLTLDELKLFTIYNVVNRDLDYIPTSESDDFDALLRRLVDAKYSPLNVRTSDIYNKTIPAANRTAAIVMATEFRIYPGLSQ